MISLLLLEHSGKSNTIFAFSTVAVHFEGNMDKVSPYCSRKTKQLCAGLCICTNVLQQMPWLGSKLFFNLALLFGASLWPSLPPLLKRLQISQQFWWKRLTMRIEGTAVHYSVKAFHWIVISKILSDISVTHRAFFWLRYPMFVVFSYSVTLTL